MNWDLRSCARHGHVLYAPDEPEPRGKVRLTSADGDVWQCLRCGSFAVPGEKSPLLSGPVADVPLVPRGKELRALVVMRLLALERYVRGAIVILLGLGAWQFHKSQGRLRDTFDQLSPHLRPIGSWIGVDLAHAGVVSSARQLLNLRPQLVLVAVFALLVYGALLITEATGLWLGKRWGEYVAVVATSMFLPLEIDELIKGPTVLKVGAFLVNVAAVVWLVYNGRLFGARGGHRAYLAARESDAVLDPADYAAGPVTIEHGAGPGEIGHEHAAAAPPAHRGPRHPLG